MRYTMIKISLKCTFDVRVNYIYYIILLQPLYFNI